MIVNQTNVDKARAAWAPNCPEWVLLLARECDRTSQGQVAERLGKSGGYISRVIRFDYSGDYGEAEQLVRARFSAERVSCPEFGDMALKTCIRNRRRPRAANWMHVQLARACPTCPNNLDRKEEDA